LSKAIASTFVNEHSLTRQFETELGRKFGANNVAAMANGTGALFCALKALGLQEGDEVIVPNLTFIATANAVILAGGIPVFADVNALNYTLCPLALESLITKKTKGIIPVQLYGQCCDMHQILQVAKKHDLFVLEDAAQGVGVKYYNQFAGTIGDAGIYSFYSNKTITTGEGGCVLTDKKEVYDQCVKLKNHGRLNKGTFIHEEIGFNFCFTDIQAALGLSQLNKLDRIISKKEKIYNYYQNEIGSIGKNLTPIQILKGVTPVYWFSSFLVEDRFGLENYLHSKGIQTRRFFCPLNLQPCYRDTINCSDSYKNSSYAYEHGLSLPSAYGLGGREMDYIVKNINKYYE